MLDEIAELKLAIGEEVQLPGAPYITSDPDMALGMALFKRHIIKVPVLFHINWIGLPDQFSNLHSLYHMPTDETEILLK